MKVIKNRSHVRNEGVNDAPEKRKGQPAHDESGTTLSKYLAHAGVCSRRKAVECIDQGIVTVNGHVITDPGHRISPHQKVAIHGEVVKAQRKVYMLVNKPKDCITTAQDERGRRTVLDIVQGAVNTRIYPIGRLDRHTTGVLLLTNDGELALKLAHPRYEIEKIYRARLTRQLIAADLQKVKKGVRLEDGFVRVDDIGFIPKRPRTEVFVTLHSGKYRVVRRLFEALGYEVASLDRVGYAGLSKQGVPQGTWRFLSPDEVDYLKQLVDDSSQE
jgi:23S rRNA pseudouridine2605 synthase